MVHIPQKCFWLLVLCYITFAKGSSIALLVTQNWLKVTLRATPALKYTEKEVGEANGLERFCVMLLIPAVVQMLVCKLL